MAIDFNVKTNFDTTKPGTIRKAPKDSKYLVDISDPNILHDFASYNCLFTLSTLRQDELENTKTLLNSAPHDIIIKSGGIGPNANRKEGPGGIGRPMTAENKKIIEGNKNIRDALTNAQLEFLKNNDMYFRDVNLRAVPPLNSSRRLTTITNISMEIVEPYGITLLERLRAGAANSGYLDHLDCPFLLTIDFVGFDENGKPLTNKIGKSAKRVIPIKFTGINLDVNQGGTNYSVTAIPYGEFGLSNTWNYPRTGGTLHGKQPTLASAVAKLEEILNDARKQEQTDGQVETPDQYEITIDESFNPDTTLLDTVTLRQVGMFQNTIDDFEGSDAGYVKGTEHDFEFLAFDKGVAITKMLEDLMKAHPNLTDVNFTKWKNKVSSTLRNAQSNAGPQGVYNEGNKMYFDYFKIRTSIIPTTQFDKKRQTNVKKVKFVVQPFKFHAYSLAIPGVVTGRNFKNFVAKTYNYAFTGENVDILDLNIQYKVSYFTSALKDVESADSGLIKSGVSSEQTQFSSSRDQGEVSLPQKSEPNSTKTESASVTSGASARIDRFMDYLTHPEADMVTLQMEILGDPAWISQSQFIPANPTKVSPGTSRDTDANFWRGNADAIWDSKRRCYNIDIAEPVINLKFRFPTDVDEVKGVYEMNDNQVAFTGLYRVIGVEHSFSGGQYKNILQCVRFNNQREDVHISDPIDEYRVVASSTGESYVTTSAEAKKLLTQDGSYATISNIGDIKNTLVSRLEYAVRSKIGQVSNSIKKRIKGFY